MNLFNRNKPSRIRKACQVAGNSEEPEEVAIEATESGPGELRRKRQEPGQQEDQQQWTRRGLFKVGFNIGSPRLRSARKFTK